MNKKLVGHRLLHETTGMKCKYPTLSGTSKLVAEENYKIIIAANGYAINSCSAKQSKCDVKPVDEQNGIYEISILSLANAELEWTIRFSEKEM